MVSWDNRSPNMKDSALKPIICKCNLPNCIPTHTLKYVQPARPENFKPIRIYSKPTIKMDADTVYKSSFQHVEPYIIKISRPPPIVPVNQLTANSDSIAKDTITKLSFPGYYDCNKRHPILPNPSSLLGSGPIMSITTQKHDYIFKSAYKQKPILPRPNLERPSGIIEKETIQKLSFPVPKYIGPPKSFKPIICYKKPEIKMESDTINKLSFLPFCVNKRETPIWAKKPCYQKPNIKMNKDTTYKLSFFPNTTCDYRPKMILPENNLSTNKDSRTDSATVYKESYICDTIPQRIASILPKPNLQLQCNNIIDPKSIYKLSFPVYCSYERRKPILPNSSSLSSINGPFQTCTTHKFDFISKPLTKVEPIKPKNLLELSKSPIDKNTTMKLSYQTNKKENYVLLKSFKPIHQYRKPEIPMENLTTQKLSFLPVKILPRENHSKAQKAQFELPKVKMDFKTTQKLSYIPPGYYIPDHDCPCLLSNQNTNFDDTSKIEC